MNNGKQTKYDCRYEKRHNEEGNVNRWGANPIDSPYPENSYLCTVIQKVTVLFVPICLTPSRKLLRQPVMQTSHRSGEASSVLLISKIICYERKQELCPYYGIQVRDPPGMDTQEAV